MSKELEKAELETARQNRINRPALASPPVVAQADPYDGIRSVRERIEDDLRTQVSALQELLNEARSARNTLQARADAAETALAQVQQIVQEMDLGFTNRTLADWAIMLRAALPKE